MEDNQKRIIEINGVKMEVDLRNAKVVDQFKVGDNVKVLISEYSDRYSSYIGTIIGFDNYEKTPTIVIAYLKTDYNSAEIKYLYYNQKTKDAEVTSLNNWDIPVTKSGIISSMQKQIESKKREVEEAEQKLVIFEELFGKFFDNASLI